MVDCQLFPFRAFPKACRFPPCLLGLFAGYLGVTLRGEILSVTGRAKKRSVIGAPLLSEVVWNGENHPALAARFRMQSRFDLELIAGHNRPPSTPLSLLIASPTQSMATQTPTATPDKKMRYSMTFPSSGSPAGSEVTDRAVPLLKRPRLSELLP